MDTLKEVTSRAPATRVAQVTNLDLEEHQALADLVVPLVEAMGPVTAVATALDTIRPQDTIKPRVVTVTLACQPALVLESKTPANKRRALFSDN